MSFNIVSAILRGKWLLDKQWATSHFPLVHSLLKGDTVDFGNRKAMDDEYDDDDDEQDPERRHGYALMAGQRNVYKVRPYTDLREIPEGSLCVVTMAGPMIKRGGMCSYGMVDQAALIQRLANAKNISGIILDIDSPGGQADGTAMLADVIKNATSSKPIICIIDDGMAASAAMWIASSASEIYVTQKTDQVGSIGVYTTIADWNAYYASEGLPVRDIYAPQSTDKNRGYYEALAGNDELIKNDLAVLADQFINTVATNRAGRIKGDDWKTGKMFYAKDAIKIGLIDGIKSFDQVVTRMNSLIPNNQKSNSNTMAFQKTLAAAKAQSFAVVDEGFALSEDQMNNVESALTAGEVAARNLVTANGTIQTLNDSITTLQTEEGKKNKIISTQAEKIIELEGRVATLGGKPSGTGSNLTVSPSTEVVKESTGDDKPRFDSDTHPANAFADSHKQYDSGIPAKK